MNAKLDTEFGNTLFKQFLDLYIVPEIRRRHETGTVTVPVDLRAAQIIFFPDERKPQVRLNSEVRALARAKLKPGMRKAQGGPVFEHELRSLKKVTLTEQEDPDCGHITFVRIGEQWTISFEASLRLRPRNSERSNTQCLCNLTD